MSRDCNDLIPKTCGKGGVTLPTIDCGGSLHIDGVDDVTLNQGVGIDLTEGVTAYDKNGNEIPYTVDPSEIDKCDVGEHTVIYRAVGDGDKMLPHIRCLRNRNHVTPLCDSLDTVVEERVVTIEQADPPHITIPDITYACEAEACDAVVSGTVIEPNTDLDPMDGVSAVDDNGNPVEVTYSGEYLKQASGTIASFPDGSDLAPAKSVTVTLEPIQDLHGYDRPWVGGGGKNLLENTASTTTTNGVTFTVNDDGTIVANGTATATAQVKVGNVAVTEGESYRVNGVTGGSASTYRISVIFYSSSSQYISETQATNGDAVITAPANAVRMDVYCRVQNGTTVNSLKFSPMVRLSSVTDATYAPYSNICPISGRTSVGTYVSGVNVWDEEWEVGTFDTATGANIAISSQIRAKNLIPVIPSATYYLTKATDMWLLFYDADFNVLSPTLSSNWQLANNARKAYPSAYGLLTIPSDAHYIRFYCVASYGTTYNHDISINYPSTDTEYHPYHGNTYTTDLGQTVYGGTLDVVSGVLTVDRGMVDLGTLNWAVTKRDDTGVYGYFMSASSLVGAKHNASNAADYTYGICSAYQTGVSPSAIYYGTATNHVAIDANARVRASRIDDSTDASAFKTAMSGVQLCYQLATPQTYQLTPTQVDLLLGQNNVWSDAGEVVVVYWHTIPQGESYQYIESGNYTVTYEAEDECGNKRTVTRDIIVATKRTVLYSDGTLIINELSTDQSANAIAHGSVTKEYIPFDPNGATDAEKYIFDRFAARPWNAERNTITSVEIGSRISPTNTGYWFTDMKYCVRFDLSRLDTSQVTNMNNMFSNCESATTLDVSGFDTSRVTNTFSMFRQCYALTTLGLSRWDTSAVTNMGYMFSQCYALADLNLDSFDTKNVTRMDYMFNDCDALTSLDLSNFNTMRLQNSERMFNECGHLQTIYTSDAFVTTQISNSDNMFANMSVNLVGGAGTVWAYLNPSNKQYAHIDGGTSNPGYFTAKN